MPEKSSLDHLSAIELSLTDRLRDPEFRREWFRAELEDDVPACFRALRERRNKTQTELAVAMGTKQPAISRFEKSSEAVWEFDFLLRMSEALDARLRVVVEAAEDIVAGYNDLPSEVTQQASSVTKLASVVPLQQITPFDKQGINLRIVDGTGKYRKLENHSSSELSIYQRQPSSFRYDGGNQKAVQLSSTGG